MMVRTVPVRGSLRMEKIYDCIVIGAGAAGCTSSIYLSRYKLDHLIFGEVIGGQFTEAHLIENYPGFISIPGPELAKKFRAHVESYGVKIIEKNIGAVNKVGDLFTVMGKDGKIYQTKTLILAMGARHKSLNVPGEEVFLGKGVSYCSTCDAPLFRGKTVAVVGGGDSAVSAAIHLADFSEKVFLVHRRNEYKAEPGWVERMRKKANIVEVLGNEVVKVEGTKFVEQIKLKNPYQGENSLKVEGLFIEIGLIPAATLAKVLGLELDEKSNVVVGPDMSTSCEGAFTAGDIVHLPGALVFRQIVTSAADGAIAAASVFQYLNQKAPSPDWG